MPKKFLIEMFCDRVAASKIYNKDKYTNSKPLEYFLKGKGHRQIMHPETSVEEKGEKETFKYIRKIRRNSNVKGK